jgi:hypothetical protein
MKEENKSSSQEERTQETPAKQARIDSWNKVDTVLGLPYCKINSGESKEVTFLDNDPTDKTSFIKGREVISIEFQVDCGGRDMTLSVTSKGLLRQIRDAAMIASLRGRTFTISASGDGMQKRYTMLEVKKP